MENNVSSAELQHQSGDTNIEDSTQQLDHDMEVVYAANNRCPLLSLPWEVREQIWEYAVSVPSPIEPRQLCPRSNKFIWSPKQIEDRGREMQINVSNAPPLVAVQLSMVCKRIYQEVAGRHVFYKVNHFKFNEDAKNTIAYLIAITNNRLEAIRSISAFWSPYEPKMPELFTAMNRCENLRHLSLYLPDNSWFEMYLRLRKGSTNIRCGQELLKLVRGLKSLEILAERGSPMPDFFEGIERVLREEMEKPKCLKYSISKFKSAQRIANLDIDGDGRLEEDRKPTSIPSRTRLQTRSFKDVATDGTLPKKVLSKYDMEGTLAWRVERILASRECTSIEGAESVEFQIDCQPIYMKDIRFCWNWKNNLPMERFWEEVSIMNVPHNHPAIMQFYRDNRDAYGKEAVVEIWKTGAGAETSMQRQVLAMFVKELEAMINTNEAKSQ
ncbi:hypothetical protein F5884DRAFT_850836 [Xylogone sp. PMI_703]|nr:hypothetical protein F5884DRAFT_850836 [Xylogone sp. PMI_703]